MTLKREAIQKALDTADPTGIEYAMARQLVEIHEAMDKYEGSTNPTDGAEFFFAIKRILGRSP